MSRFCRHLLLILAGVGGLLASARAADESQVLYPGDRAGGSAPAAQAGGTGFVTVAAVVVLLGAGGWMFWKGKKVNLGGRETKLLAIDETRSLGNRQYLVVASYEGKKFLLGVCPGRIDLLAPITGASREEKS